MPQVPKYIEYFNEEEIEYLKNLAKPSSKKFKLKDESPSVKNKKIKRDRNSRLQIPDSLG